MSVQYGPIPIRASADTRLGGPDFRLLVRIAYYDRFSRNGVGCYVNARRLAKESGVHYKHLSRYADRLEEFGYIRIAASKTDKRRNVYSVVYDEAEIVTSDGDNLGDEPSRTDSPSAQSDIVTLRGDYRAMKVTKSKPQTIDSQAKPAPKRSSEANLRDPAKPCARNGKNSARCDTGKPKHIARQRYSGSGNSRAQKHMMLPIQGKNQKQQTGSPDPDWNGWAAWLERERGMTNLAAWELLMTEPNRIATERGIDLTAAEAIFDQELKRRRKAPA